MAVKFDRISNLIIVLVTLIVTSYLIEICSQLIIKKLPAYDSRWVFRAKKPPAYSDSPYFSAEFMHESSNGEKGKFDDKVRRLVNFEGKYINVIDGHRRTAFVPEDAKNTVYIYGASTIYSQEVPDEYTIPSIVQRKINEITTQYKVVNYGVSSMNSEQQLFFLHETTLKEGDIVIFFDGGCDIIYKVYNDYEYGLNINTLRNSEKPGVLESRILPVLEKLKLIYFAELLKYIKQQSPPLHTRNAEEVNARAIKASENFANNIRLAHQYSKASGADFYHFLQPSIFSLKSRTKHEQFLIDNFLLTPPGMEFVYTHSIDKFANQSDALNADGIISVDLRSVLDNKQGEVFLDFAHTTERANEIIATAIFSMVRWKR
ncbi:hypothetical protein CWO84_05850 [Methylomonas sp. Kb3]|uniref:hypothetical protein n=1 Tax=Methylomonas sp. Kb3 TaxID=1611544 RepID=UPI000C33A387|nr:hypothetical protein [Methylomonas sp. Kb3]PKD41225.1 hypothetical protein CWO84_05850 [Methylomonas sp. Kb3]